MKDVKVISYIIPGKGRSENFKGTGGGSTTIINNVGGSSNSDTPAGSVQYAEEAGTAKYAEEAGKARLAERANLADEATHAQNTDMAANAAEAEHAKHADVAVNAQRADEADHAASANEAIHAQTADRVGKADHAKTADLATLAKNLTADSTDWQKIDGKIGESEKRAEKKFLSKLHDDVAKGKITFEDFITLVRGMWLGDAKIVRAIQSGAAVEADDTAIMTVAKMIGTFLRKDTEDETRYLLKLLGGAIFAWLKTPDWTAGGMLGTGIGAYQDAGGMWVIECDKLLVRVKAIFEELEIRRLSYVGGNLLLSGAGSVITAVEDKGTFWRCNIKNDDGTTATMNYWRAGDQARCQTFNIKAGVYQNVQNRYWWRLVTEVGEDYIDVSKSDCEASSDAPAAGDHVVQLGNRTDTERQHAIMLSAVGTDAPAITQYQGINSYRLTGRQKTRISPHGNVFTGDFYLNDGRSLLQVIDGKITSVISETVRTATDKDNYLTNGSFATDLNGWQGNASTRYFKVGAKYVWANKSPLANKLGNGTSWTTDDGLGVARIANSQLVQLAADYAKTPEIKTVNSKKQAVPVYVSMYVKVLEAGTLTISIAGETTTGYDTFTALSYSEALTADNDYIHVEATGYWSGTGNFTIATNGVMLIHDVMLTLNEYTYYESRIEQTKEHILLEVQRVENKVDSNTTRVGALEVTAESITARVSAVETTASGNSTAIGQLQVRATAIEASVTAVDTKADGIATRVAALEVTAESITSRVTAVESTASGNSTAIGQLQVRATAIEASVTAVDTKADGIATRVGALEITADDITASVSDIEDDVDGLTTRVGTLETTATSITARVTAVETTASSNTTRIGTLETTAQSITASVSDIEDDVDGLTTRVGTLETTATSITATVENISDTVDGHTTSISQLQIRAGQIESSVSSVTSTANSNSTAISTLTQTVSGISATVSEHTETLSDLGDSVEDISDRTTTLETTVNGISATVSSHTSSISSLGSSVGTLGSSLTSVTDRVAALEVTASGLTSTVSSHTTQINQLGNAVDDNDRDINSLNTSVSTISQMAGNISSRVTTIENDYATGTQLTQTANTISAKINKVLDNQGGRNLLASSLINETSTLYGFAFRALRLTAGQQYTFSVNGMLTAGAASNNMALRCYIWRYAVQADVNAGNAQAVGDWIGTQQIEILSTSAQTRSVTFTADKTAEYSIGAYMHYRAGTNPTTNGGGNRSYGVTVNWYKVERGEDATAWMPGADDQLLWKNYILNPRAIDANIDDDYCTEEVDQHADPIFGEFVQVDHDTAQNWQITFTAGNNYNALVGKVTTWFVICRCVNGYEVQEGDNRKRLCFGGGDENVGAVDTATAAFTDLGNGWRKYYATRQIATGLMANNSGVDTQTIGINCVQGRWDVWAVGVVMGGVCPSVQEIMERCGQLATGIDITNEKIVITANKFVVQTNSGQKTLIAANGKVNIDLLDVNTIVANGISAQTINANNATFQNIKITGNSEFGGSLKAKLFYAPVKTVTTTPYQIDPANDPFTTFLYNEVSGAKWIRLPKASDYDGMEITVFIKSTQSHNVTENYVKIAPKSGSGDSLFIAQNIAHVSQASNYYANPKNVPVHDYSAQYYAITGGCYLIPNCLYTFKSMLGAWYAIKGLFTGE